MFLNGRETERCRLSLVPLREVADRQRLSWLLARRATSAVVLASSLALRLDFPSVGCFNRGAPEQQRVFQLPYSDHSSREELHNFLLKLKPRQIFGSPIELSEAEKLAYTSVDTFPAKKWAFLIHFLHYFTLLISNVSKATVTYFTDVA